MIGSLPRYTQMRESGFDWLGPVPAHWRVQSLGSLVRFRSERGRPELPLLSVVRERGVIPRLSMAEDENRNFIPDDLSNYKVVRAGDLVINKMKAWQGSLGIAPTDGIVSPAYFVLSFAMADSQYGHLLLRSRPYVAFFAQVSEGVRIGQWDLAVSGMKRIPVVIPPEAEQQAIVQFVAYADQRISRFIASKQKLIGLLAEQKQAVMYDALHRGQSPEAEMKASGVAWLGDVPKHWPVLRLGRLIELTTGFPFKSEGFSQNDGDIRLLRGINVTPGRLRWTNVVRWPTGDSEAHAAYKLREGDVVLGMDRPIVSAGVRAARVGPEDIPALLLQRVARIRPGVDLDPDFTLFLLSSKAFADYLAPIFTGVSVPHISPEQIRGFRIALPPMPEQLAIVAALRTATRALDDASIRANEQIELVREYLARLIFDVATGKRDVRHTPMGPQEAAEFGWSNNEADGSIIEDEELSDLDVVQEEVEA